eukprot:TRINITY_DN3311_c0_g1_i1.p2 TRINITY_DN3311_c0_g1~~TRINITY_DN3311_c0_g1_i1.p2  ORF type:complete len:109 (+),score=23.21 TRINITY_DN3311_c0_g1_i1:438-764(+)
MGSIINEHKLRGAVTSARSCPSPPDTQNTSAQRRVLVCRRDKPPRICAPALGSGGSGPARRASAAARRCTTAPTANIMCRTTSVRRLHGAPAAAQQLSLRLLDGAGRD